MKRFFALTALFLCTALSFSCGTGKGSGPKNDNRDENRSEIGFSDMEGGETLQLFGYSDDGEVERKLKTLDIDLIECYQKFIGAGEAQNINIGFSLFIDEDGSFEQINIANNRSKTANKIAKCVKSEIEELEIRPGKPRKADYRLVYKITNAPKKAKNRNQTNDLRAKMISSLAQMKKFRICYDSQRAKNPNLTGRFTLAFTITFDGEVTDVTVKNNTFTNKAVVKCAVEQMEDTVFPKGDSDDEVEVNFDYTATHQSPTPAKPRKSLSL